MAVPQYRTTAGSSTIGAGYSAGGGTGGVPVSPQYQAAADYTGQTPIAQPTSYAPQVQSQGLSLQMPSGGQALQAQAQQLPAATQKTDSIESQGTGGGGGAVGAVFDMVHMAVSDQMNMINFVGNIKKDKLAVKQWDKVFAENVRQYNLEYALQEFSTRKGLELQEVQQKFNNDLAKKNFDINALLADANLKSGNVNRRAAEFDLNQKITDSKKRNLVAKAAMRGIARGLTSGQTATD